MKVELEIQEKPKEDILSRKGNNPDEIYNLDEVQAIKNANENLSEVSQEFIDTLESEENLDKTKHKSSSRLHKYLNELPENKQSYTLEKLDWNIENHVLDKIDENYYIHLKLKDSLDTIDVKVTLKELMTLSNIFPNITNEDIRNKALEKIEIDANLLSMYPTWNGKLYKKSLTEQLDIFLNEIKNCYKSNVQFKISKKQKPKEKLKELDEINAELKINDNSHEMLGDEKEEKEDKVPNKNSPERC